MPWFYPGLLDPAASSGNVSHSVGRIICNMRSNDGKRVAPTMLESQQRLLTSEESLIIQGFPFQKTVLPEKARCQAFLQYLAGNVMALFVALAIF